MTHPVARLALRAALLLAGTAAAWAATESLSPDAAGADDVQPGVITQLVTTASDTTDQLLSQAPRPTIPISTPPPAPEPLPAPPAAVPPPAASTTPKGHEDDRPTPVSQVALAAHRALGLIATVIVCLGFVATVSCLSAVIVRVLQHDQAAATQLRDVSQRLSTAPPDHLRLLR